MAVKYTKHFLRFDFECTDVMNDMDEITDEMCILVGEFGGDADIFFGNAVCSPYVIIEFSHDNKKKIDRCEQSFINFINDVGCKEV